ncbi:syntaxin-16-like protein [Sarcoptes scabiei]|uniref:Syntaxin-16-like protein n=1 Tax=Sarcoptes scabiei TaxID=52283 RepID=A0A132AB71_SARSC|nr:syntaxin-16-like protein [Sarcoptes scabiei]
MLRRSHNETYVLLRNNAQKNRSFYRDFNKDDERVKLVSDVYDDNDDYDEDDEVFNIKSANRSLNDSGSPPWISSLNEFRFEWQNIKEKIEQLKAIQLEHLKQQNTSIFADEITTEKLKQYEEEIEQRCHELNIQFNRLHSILMHFKTLKSHMTLTQLFRSCQRVYVERRDEANKIDPEFVITFDTDRLIGLDEFDEDFTQLTKKNNLKSNNFDDDDDDNRKQIKSFQLQQQKQILLEENVDEYTLKHLKERENEMNTIQKSFVELNRLFQEVNALVIDQGSALDRIDYNLEQGKTRIEHGLFNLEKAHRNLNKSRKHPKPYHLFFIIIISYPSILIPF